MSWAEVKKFLNKRNDKSLNEIIEERTLCSSIMKHTSYQYEEFNNATKTFTGKGRILVDSDRWTSTCKIDGGPEIALDETFGAIELFFNESVVIKNTETGGYYTRYIVFFE